MKEDYKNGYVADNNRFLQRLKGIWDVITRRNFILITYNLVDTPNGVAVKNKMVVRSDYNVYADIASIQLAKEMLEDRAKKLNK